MKSTFPMPLAFTEDEVNLPSVNYPMAFMSTFFSTKDAFHKWDIQTHRVLNARRHRPTAGPKHVRVLSTNWQHPKTYYICIQFSSAALIQPTFYKRLPGVPVVRTKREQRKETGTGTVSGYTTMVDETIHHREFRWGPTRAHDFN